VREVDGDAAILRSLASAEFPAERCAADNPVSDHDGTPVLVTDWVPGERSDGRGRAFGVLGALLGSLHSRAGDAALALLAGADELARLADVIPARPLTMDVWAFGHRRQELGEVLAHLSMNRAAGQRISAQVAELPEH
jgi:hypothetical protein